VEYCEQPVKYWDHDGMRVVREAVSIPIMADESVFDVHDAEKLAERGSCDYFNIKLAKSSGILGGMQIAAFAEERGIPCMVGSMSETRLGLSAAAHLVSARSIVRFADLDTHFDHSIDPVVGGVRITGADVEIPEAPGHGADLSPDFLATAPTILID
jgi:L-alanine-DL-glutamate epimerase-like enolase superfamily enzyme